jgi:hypothetical protein
MQKQHGPNFELSSNMDVPCPFELDFKLGVNY